jgi:hypothetical protein
MYRPKHIKVDDVSRVTKGTSNATMVSKATVVSKVIVETVCPSVIVTMWSRGIITV